MSNPHPPYPNPGPSSYYHSPPPPPFYGNGPNPGPYYPYPVPPMNGHVPMHHPSPPRASNAGRGRYGPHRGGVPAYQHYQPMHPHHNMHPSMMQSPPVSPVNSYTHPQKYSSHIPHVSYSPPYPPQTNGSYAPAWGQQPLSPLPNHLSMLSPVPPPVHTSVPPPPLYEQPDTTSLPAPTQDDSTEHPSTSVDPSEGAAPSVEVSSPLKSTQPAPPAESEPVSPKTEDPPAPQVVACSPAFEQLSELSVEQQRSFQIPEHPARSKVSDYVIWSRRPRNPSDAPGLIISTHAFPPEDIVEKASDVRTPPTSPRRRPAEVAVQGDIVPEVPVSEHISQEAAEAPSSSATETTPASSERGDTPVPGSPASSHTSISIASTNTGASKSLAMGNADIALSVSASAETASAMAPSTSIEPTQSATTPAVALIPASVPAQSTTKAPPAPRKSWASLLQSSDTTASSSKSRLPVSTVIGFSIPATGPSGSSPSQGTSIASSHRNELLNLLNSGPGPANVPLKIQPRGLINTGNMCFANAVLQILVYCPPFNKLFTDLSKCLSGPVVGSQKEGTRATPLVDAIILFMKEFVPASSKDSNAKGKEREDDFYEPESFIPSYVYDAMKEKKRFSSMIGGHQEDAEEFLGFFLDTLEEELLSISSSLLPKQASGPSEQEGGGQSQDDGWYEVGKKNRTVATRTVKSTESPITRIFGGKFRSTLRAPHQKDSVTVEDWRSLRLDIQREQVRSIKDALQQISHPQPVQISQPTRPGLVVDATQQALIDAVPPVLVLHLKRFLYDTTVGDVIKIGKQVAFEPELSINPDLIAPTRRTTHPIRYQLFGVLYHHGQSASGGHYTLDVLHPNRDLNDKPRSAWIRIDDELVSDIRPDDVFGLDRDDRCAYLLFYRRIGSGWGPMRT